MREIAVLADDAISPEKDPPALAISDRYPRLKLSYKGETFYVQTKELIEAIADVTGMSLPESKR